MIVKGILISYEKSAIEVRLPIQQIASSLCLVCPLCGVDRRIARPALPRFFELLMYDHQNRRSFLDLDSSLSIPLRTEG